MFIPHLFSSFKWKANFESFFEEKKIFFLLLFKYLGTLKFKIKKSLDYYKYQNLKECKRLILHRVKIVQSNTKRLNVFIHFCRLLLLVFPFKSLKPFFSRFCYFSHFFCLFDFQSSLVGSHEIKDSLKPGGGGVASPPSFLETPSPPTESLVNSRKQENGR